VAFNDELHSTISSVADRVGPSVVGIGSRQRGSGVVVDGKVLTSVEHTAPLAPGSSGGLIVDAGGALIGLNTNRLGEGFYLALPADTALRERVDQFGRGESVRRPRLGVAVASSHVARRLRRSVGLPERDGLLVRGVEDDSPAARAGIQEGDLIVGAAGRDVSDADTLFEALASAGDTFEVRILRGTEERTVQVGGMTAATGEA
jgi:serine protease Do